MTEGSNGSEIDTKYIGQYLSVQKCQQMNSNNGLEINTCFEKPSNKEIK